MTLKYRNLDYEVIVIVRASRTCNQFEVFTERFLVEFQCELVTGGRSDQLQESLHSG